MKQYVKWWLVFLTVVLIGAMTLVSAVKLNQKEKVYKVTAYCACEKCCKQFADGITASGYKLRGDNKLCAASPTEFNFCDVIIIPGYGTVPVLDSGVGVGCVDVYFKSHQDALNWGVQYLEIKREK